MAASSPAWLTRRAEAKKARWSGVSSAMGFEVCGGGSNAALLAVEAERVVCRDGRRALAMVEVAGFGLIDCRRAAATQALQTYGEGMVGQRM